MLRKDKLGTVTFNNSKNELLCAVHCNICIRYISSRGFSVAINKGKINRDILRKTTVFVLPGTREGFDIQEITCLQKYIKDGGKLLVTDHCGKTSNINLLLDIYGIEFRKDSTFRTHRAKNYNHPCESLISDGVVNNSLYFLSMGSAGYFDIPTEKKLHILYPYGCTLNIRKPSAVLFSSGSVCFPLNRPICGFYQDFYNDGRIVAVGSTMMFSDNYIIKEDNLRFLDIILKLLTDENVHLNMADIQCPNVADYAQIPCISGLSNCPFSCLQLIDEIQMDETECLRLLRQNKLYQIDNRHVVKVFEAYKELNLEKTLRIIKPKFESPLPALVPAVVPPRFRSLTNPPLELLDLDESFMSATLRLLRLTYKCTDDDLEYYIQEFGKIVDIHQSGNAKCTLNYVCKKLSAQKANKMFY